MKRGTTPILKVKLDIDDLTSISRIDFMLKQHCDEGCETKVLKTYPSASVSLDTSTWVFSISYTEQETRTFEQNEYIYLDVRPVLTNGKVIATEIAKLYVDATLFANTEINDD